MKSTFRIDPRWILIVIQFVPTALFLFGIVIAVYSWQLKSLFISAIVILFFILAHYSAKHINNICYAICKSLLKSRSDALINGKYLFFHIENIETFNKFKVIPDDMGIIRFEDNKYIIETLTKKYETSLDNSNLEIYEKSKLAIGVKISFIPSDFKDKVTIIGQFIYKGTDLKLAANQLKKSKWAIDCILSWGKK